MGIILCTSGKEKNEISNIIEKSISNKQTTLDRKIYEEYYCLKELLKPHKKQVKSINKEYEKDNFPIIVKKNNFISVKKRMERFVKWYFMSHPNQNPSLKKSRFSTSESNIITKINKSKDYKQSINNSHNTSKFYHNQTSNTMIKKHTSDGCLNNAMDNNRKINPIANLKNAEINYYEDKNSHQRCFNYKIEADKNENFALNNNECPKVFDKQIEFIVEKDKFWQNDLQSANKSFNLDLKFKNVSTNKLVSNSINNNLDNFCCNLNLSNKNNNDKNGLCNSFLNHQSGKKLSIFLIKHQILFLWQMKIKAIIKIITFKNQI